MILFNLSGAQMLNLALEEMLVVVLRLLLQVAFQNVKDAEYFFWAICKVDEKVQDEGRHSVCPNNTLELFKSDVLIQSVLRLFHVRCYEILQNWIVKDVLGVRAKAVVVLAEHWFQLLQIR